MEINEYFKYLSIGLPNDIERCKQYGDFDRATRLIEKRLNENIPEALKKCMIAERELMKRIKYDYPYTRTQALSVVRKMIPDFSDDEFAEYVDSNKIDWIYVNGEERYFKLFYQSLLKMDAELAGRTGKNNVIDTKRTIVDDAISDMKQNGKSGYRFRVRASIKINDDNFIPGKRVRAYLPIPAKCKQHSDIVINEVAALPHIIAPENAAQRTICFDTALDKNSEFFVDYSYTSIVNYFDAYHADGLCGKYDFDMNERPPHIMFTPYIRELADCLTANADNPMQKARSFYDFITKNVKYSFMRDYRGLSDIAANCARNLRGDCGVQALLFITLCRYAGIPARWQSGLVTMPLHIGAHDWAEFYVEPYGWLFADLSFGGGAFRAGNETRHEFYFGNINPFRMVANREFYAPFTPAMKFCRRDPYDNQLGEIEYADGCIEPNEYTCSQTMVEYNKLY